MPSADELNAIWDNLVDDGGGNNSGVGDFAEYDYWNSSEYTDIFAYTQSFNTGDMGFNAKDYLLKVRAVRAF